MSNPVFSPRDETELLQRALLTLSSSVFFDDVTGAIVANAASLSGAQNAALWLRENEIAASPNLQNTSENWICVARHNAQKPTSQNTASQKTNAQNANAQNAISPTANVQNANAQNANAQNANAQNAISPTANVQNANAQNVNAQNANAQNANAQNVNAQNANTQSETSQKSDAPTSAVLQAARGEIARTSNETAFPLLKDARVVGVLQLENAGENADRVLELFCAHAAIALLNARLFSQLENAKLEWETTFDSMIDGVLVESRDGTILRANQVAARLFDLDVRQIIGCTRRELHAKLPDYQELRALSSLPNDVENNIGSSEFRFGTPARIVLETVFPLQLKTATHRSVSTSQTLGEERQVRVLRDITERSRLEEQLLQSEKLAALGELISGFAHELNNPLTTVTGYAQLLQDDAALPANARRQIEHIYQDASRASRIVANLLAFARREETRQEPVDINAALRQAVEMRAYQLQAENVRLTFEYSNDLPLVSGDSQQLQQVFLNVFNNAQQALGEWRGGGTIAVETRRAVVGGAAGVLVSISDNGPGIAPDHLRRIFDPFWTTKSAGEGTGLGMSISLGIVSRHNGRIWVESTLGQGARFFIELPGASAEEQFCVVETRIENESSTRTETVSLEENRGAQILVVDDEEPVILLMTEVLGLDDHEVTPAFNGGEALALLKERDFDLILSDVRMPAVGGPTFFEILQTARPDLLPRVVFVTGDTMSRSTQDFLKTANRPMLAKPFDPDRLRALVREQLQQNRS